MLRKTRQLDQAAIRDAKATLERVLDAVRSGELTAPSGMVARLEGAIAALEAFLGYPNPPPAA